MSTNESPPGGGATATEPGPDFIRSIIAEDLEAGRHERIVTRFPPEPNGYLHIGHAKAICVDFGVAEEIPGAICNLRFDDTNPTREETEFVEAIQEDIRWLGFDWDDRLYFASDYFETLYGYAVELVEKELAYVDSQSAEEMRARRGTLTEPGTDSPYRNRSVAENLDLFARMRAGEFEDGTHVLRAKIDMASPNLNMRDPTVYRIRRAHHHRTGDAWPIYPMYDFQHPLSDAIEGITHSLCSLEYEDHRPLYDWMIANVTTPGTPRQLEFARLNLTYTAMSKRKMRLIVGEGHVDGWDDPRMWTLSGMRRRGYPAAAIRAFCDRIGLAKRDSVVDFGFLEYCVREELNKTSPRVMGVLRPLKVVIDNYPDDQVEEFEAINNPEDPTAGARKVPFSKVLYIERDDFMEDPPKKFFRLAPGREVRLRAAYLVTCTDVVKDASGDVTEVRCTYDPETRGGSPPDGRRVKGTLHWVSAAHAVPALVRIYDHLFAVPEPDETEGVEFADLLNPSSKTVISGARVEPSLAGAAPGARYQLERLGYFCVDSRDSTPSQLVLNRTVTLRDTWAKVQKQEAARSG